MNIPSVADLVPDRDILDGDKVRIESVLNLPLIVTGWEITRSKVKKDEQRERSRLDEKHAGANYAACAFRLCGF